MFIILVLLIPSRRSEFPSGIISLQHLLSTGDKFSPPSFSCKCIYFTFSFGGYFHKIELSVVAFLPLFSIHVVSAVPWSP